MADNTTWTPGSGLTIATDDISSVHYPRTKIGWGVDGVYNDASASNPLPVTTGGLTDTQLRATAVPVSVSGTVTVTGGLTDTQLRATAVPVSGTFWQATQPISASALPLPTGAATETTLASVYAAFKAEDSAAASGDLGLPLLAMRQLADTTSTSDDGDYTLLKMDEEGRLKVATKPASFAIVTGNITTSTGTVSANVSRASNVMISMVATSLVGHNVTFEGSIDSTDGTDGNWFGIQVIRSNANTIELTSGVLAATPAYAWEASVNGLSFIRVRATAHTSGTATWKFQRGSYATEPIPAAQISGTQPVSGTVTATVANATANLIIPTTVADVASAALTTTTTTGTLTPTAGVSYQVNIPVTVVSGTNPTLDVRIEESDDTGTNWYTVFEFPRITATGSYRSPMLPVRGNRIRYVQTVGGTTPSFTRAINRLQSNLMVNEVIRQIFDRAVTLTTLNSTTGSVPVQNCRNVAMVVNVGAITTTAPALQMEGSDDGGATWYSVGAPLTAVASSTVKLTVNDTNCQLLRARVSTAGVGVTAGYVLLRGF